MANTKGKATAKKAAVQDEVVKENDTRTPEQELQELKTEFSSLQSAYDEVCKERDSVKKDYEAACELRDAWKEEATIAGNKATELESYIDSLPQADQGRHLQFLQEVYNTMPPSPTPHSYRALVEKIRDYLKATPEVDESSPKVPSELDVVPLTEHKEVSSKLTEAQERISEWEAWAEDKHKETEKLLAVIKDLQSQDTEDDGHKEEDTSEETPAN